MLHMPRENAIPTLALSIRDSATPEGNHARWPLFRLKLASPYQEGSSCHAAYLVASSAQACTRIGGSSVEVERFGQMRPDLTRPLGGDFNQTETQSQDAQCFGVEQRIGQHSLTCNYRPCDYIVQTFSSWEQSSRSMSLRAQTMS